jgi:hypothetical protein
MTSLRIKILWRVTVVQNLNLSQLLTNGQILNTHAFMLCQEKNTILQKILKGFHYYNLFIRFNKIGFLGIILKYESNLPSHHTIFTFQSARLWCMVTGKFFKF